MIYAPMIATSGSRKGGGGSYLCGAFKITQGVPSVLLHHELCISLVWDVQCFCSWNDSHQNGYELSAPTIITPTPHSLSQAPKTFCSRIAFWSIVASWSPSVMDSYCLNMKKCSMVGLDRSPCSYITSGKMLSLYSAPPQ